MIDTNELRHHANGTKHRAANITPDWDHYYRCGEIVRVLCDALDSARAEIERLEAAYANVVARVATNHMTNLLNKRRGPHKPQSRDGCGDDSCQHCLQYNWSDPGR